MEIVEIDLRNGDHKKPEYLAINPYGQVPTIEDEGMVLSDSNAILVYLAHKYADEKWFPKDPVGAAKVQRFLSLAAGEVAFGPSLARKITLFKAPLDYNGAKATTERLFSYLEKHLSDNEFLTGEHPTIADLSNYTYIAHAPEGNISLQDYPRITTWLKKIESLPGFIPMKSTKIPLA